MSAGLYLVKGSDVLRDRELAKLLDELLGDEDRSFALEEFTVPGGSRTRRGAGDDESAADDSDAGGSTVADEREATVHAILGAASSPPFMTASRVIVVRDCNNLVKADVEAFARWLDDPLDTTVLVFVAGGAMAALEKVLKAADVSLRQPLHEATKDVLLDAAHEAGVLLTKDAAARIESHLAEDAGRAVALIDILASAADAAHVLDVDDVAPYLGAEGGVAPLHAHERDRGGRRGGRARGAAPTAHRHQRSVSRSRCTRCRSWG